MLYNFISGTGPENYVFPIDGTFASQLKKGEFIQNAVADWYQKNKENVDKRDYYNTTETSYHSSYTVENAYDFMHFGNLTNVPNFVGSANISVSPYGNGRVLVSVFNITSATSGDYLKHFSKNPFPSSYVRSSNPNDVQRPYSNISQHFYFTESITDIVSRNILRRASLPSIRYRE